MRDNAIVIVRTDAREFTHSATVEALRTAFPNKNLREEPRPLKKKNTNRSIRRYFEEAWGSRYYYDSLMILSKVEFNYEETVE